MGHIRLGTLSQTKKWLAVVELLGDGASAAEIAEASADAANRDMARMPQDETFRFVLQLLAMAPREARSPNYS